MRCLTLVQLYESHINRELDDIYLNKIEKYIDKLQINNQPRGIIFKPSKISISRPSTN